MSKFKLSKGLAIAAACAAVCAAVAVPLAYGQWYVAGNSSEASSATGVYDIVVTVDDSAQGGPVYTKLVFVPSDATVEDALDEMVVSSNNQTGIEALHDYAFSSIRDKVANGSYEVRVYGAGSQAPGTQAVHDTEGTLVSDLATYELQRYDNVVFTLK